jgi:hypothetical protein
MTFAPARSHTLTTVTVKPNLALVLGLTLMAAGCGGTETEPTTPEAAQDTTAEAETEPAESSRCLPVGASLKKGIASGLTVGGGGKLGKALSARRTSRRCGTSQPSSGGRAWAPTP